ncbi:glycosyltransferase family 29 protein [Microbacterium terricola]|uniref:Glycosyl transferase family 1 domain-containing protein n=1 Tax=Microbacterium terricola TaxID=344163 RepID=A0ABM8DWR4_9MICO|nr:glycosyltransferase family 29 protein [Microbacterium terricola]UYK39233.1 glycosyltransferase family 29 protein [Microbacterium terricola]BDV30047.1 hypothetical protein Microterr_07070 [Microbacterium terricola]
MKNTLKKIPLVRTLARRLRSLRRRLTARRTGRATLPRGTADRSVDRAWGDDYALTRVEWRDQGPTPALLARARSLSRNTVAWDILPARIWLVFCAALLEAGDRETAERVLRTWVAKKPNAFEALATCLPVARFARDIGVRSGPVERAAAAADVLAANRDADIFGAYVAGKTIAVVGNGPGNLHSGLGATIDAHDIVIRFNNFPKGYEADYGSRTDIWVRGAHREVADRYVIEHFGLVVWEMDLFRNLLEVPSHGDILSRDTRFSPDRVTHIDTATKLSLWESSGLLLPTSGAQILWMLKERLGSLQNVDVYGFSTLDDTDDYGHFFDGLGDMQRRHDVSGEGAFLRTLFADPVTGSAGDPLHRWERSAREQVAAADVASEGGAHSDVAAPAPARVTIVGSAYREYDPAAGKTGGPGGVLATQRVALGDEYRGHPIEYRFQGTDKAELRERLGVQIAGLSGKIADIIIGAEHIRTDPGILRMIDDGRTPLFVCHELGSAYGAYLLGAPYVLVYHQQGSTLQEMRSIGRTPTPHETNVVTRLERLICDNAQKVFFPSLGARDTYRATSRDGLDGHANFADWALYNTVSAVDHDDDASDRRHLIASLRRELRLPAKDEQTDVFLSVGDFNHDKGLDRVPALLERHAALSGRRVVWIAVGAASDKERFAELEAQSKHWNFTARLIGERMTHDRLLALLDDADYYVMLHRNSIFDLATLEAMRAGKALILSPVGGNTEVDLDGNVLFVTEETIDDACRVLETRDPVEWGQRNRRVFEDEFSLERFAGRYRRMLDEQLDALAAEDAAPAVAGRSVA